jgi:hypothetical protein
MPSGTHQGSPTEPLQPAVLGLTEAPFHAPLNPLHRQSARRAFKDTERSLASVRPERRILGGAPIRSRLTAGWTQFQRWNCVRDSAWAIRLIAFITEPGPIWRFLAHPWSHHPSRRPTVRGELVHVHDDRDLAQASPDELPAVNIHSLRQLTAGRQVTTKPPGRRTQRHPAPTSEKRQARREGNGLSRPGRR